MSDTTLEEASRCPKCTNPGEYTGERTLESVRGGAKAKEFTCRNERCKWYNQVCSVVQVNPNGTIPPATLRRPKQFAKLPDDGGRTLDAIRTQLIRETSREGGEIQGRY